MESIVVWGLIIGLAVATRLRGAAAWVVRSTPRTAQSTVEYAIVAAVIAVIAIAAVNGLRQPLTSAFSAIGSCVTGALGNGGGGC
ncbi:MAG TPA: hypothetical protein VFG86_18065 [Chloroflexota bacterium]|nr:hypothetical protein [Chloroflexota bacterium]